MTLLKKEKEFTLSPYQLNQERRELPWIAANFYEEHPERELVAKRIRYSWY